MGYRNTWNTRTLCRSGTFWSALGRDASPEPRIEQRGFVTAPKRKEIERDTGEEKQGGEDRGCAGQGVGCAARRKKSAEAGAASANAERTTFRTLKENETDERDGDQEFGDDKDGLQGSVSLRVCGRLNSPIARVTEGVSGGLPR